MLSIKKQKVKSSLYTRFLHRFQERIRNPEHRNIIYNLINFWRKKYACKNMSQVDILKKDGIYFMPNFVDKNKLNELIKKLEKMPCVNPWDKSGDFFYRSNIPNGTHVAQIPEAVTIKELHDIATSEYVLDLVGGYFGVTPCLDSIQAWWSIPGNDSAEEAENFHRDNDALKFLKLFIYASDVDEQCGPHVFVKGSHGNKKLIARRRLTDIEVENNFAENMILRINGKAGDAFIEDTYGIHKGTLPISGYRLLIQFRYSVRETIFRSPILVDKFENSNRNFINLIAK